MTAKTMDKKVKPKNGAGTLIFPKYIRKPKGYRPGSYEPVHLRMKVGVKEAKAWLDTNQGNRTLSTKRIKRYAGDIASNRWEFNGDAICFDINGNLRDGQHRLHAILKAGLPIDTMIIIGLTEQAVKTKDQLKPRTAGDIFQLAGVPYAHTAASICKWILDYEFDVYNMEGNMQYGNTQLLDFYQATPEMPYIVKEASRLSGEGGRIVSAKYIGGPLFYLNKIDPIKAKHFINGFALGEDLRRGQVLYMLHQRFKLIKSQRNFRPTNRYKSGLIIKAWNFYVIDEEMDVKHMKFSIDEKFPQFMGLKD